MKISRELTKEELLKYAGSHFLTVGKLKAFLEKYQLPDDALVVVQRIEDKYYEKHGWGVYLKKGEQTHNLEQFNKDVESGKYLDKEQYPLIKEENLKLFTEEEIKESMEQYHPAWSYVFYKDDPDVLFLDLHY